MPLIELPRIKNLQAEYKEFSPVFSEDENSESSSMSVELSNISISGVKVETINKLIERFLLGYDEYKKTKINIFTRDGGLLPVCYEAVYSFVNRTPNFKSFVYLGNNSYSSYPNDAKLIADANLLVSARREWEKLAVLTAEDSRTDKSKCIFNYLFRVEADLFQNFNLIPIAYAQKNTVKDSVVSQHYYEHYEDKEGLLKDKTAAGLGNALPAYNLVLLSLTYDGQRQRFCLFRNDKVVYTEPLDANGKTLIDPKSSFSLDATLLRRSGFESLLWVPEEKVFKSLKVIQAEIQTQAEKTELIKALEQTSTTIKMLEQEIPKLEEQYDRTNILLSGLGNVPETDPVISQPGKKELYLKMMLEFREAEIKQREVVVNKQKELIQRKAKQAELSTRLACFSGESKALSSPSSSNSSSSVATTSPAITSLAQVSLSTAQMTIYNSQGLGRFKQLVTGLTHNEVKKDGHQLVKLTETDKSKILLGFLSNLRKADIPFSTETMEGKKSITLEYSNYEKLCKTLALQCQIAKKADSTKSLKITNTKS